MEVKIVDAIKRPAATFAKGELIVHPDFDTVFLVVDYKVAALGEAWFDGVAIRHANYPFGTLVQRVTLHSASKWEVFSGSITLTQ